MNKGDNFVYDMAHRASRVLSLPGPAGNRRYEALELRFSPGFGLRVSGKPNPCSAWGF